MSAHLQAWRISADEYPAGGFASDQLEFLLGYAVLAPSTHNTQPWLFRINAMDVEIFGDGRRRLRTADPTGREWVMSCGAALYNLRVAAEYFEKAYRVDPFPDADRPDLLARLNLGLSGDTSSEDVLLFHAIPQRHTHRGPFRPEPPPAEVLEALSDAAEHEGAWLRLVEDPDTQASLADLVAEADRRQWADKAFRQELAAWIRTKPEQAADGLPGHSLGIKDWMSFAGPSIVRTFDRGQGQAASDRDIALHSPVLAVLGTATDDRQAWLTAGQALQAVLLRARSEDVWASFLNQPVELPELREQLASWCGNGHPQTVLRLGCGDPAEPTPRRGVRELLIRH